MDTVVLFGRYDLGPAAGLERGEGRRELVEDGSPGSAD